MVKAIILDGTQPDHTFASTVRDTILIELKSHNWDVEVITLAKASIRACKGCFHCWVKTPGLCIMDDDDANRIMCKLVNSNLTIYLTPIVYGGYSHLLKRALDRAISSVMPFFKKIQGEIHHKKRYDRYAPIVAFGILPEMNVDESAIFKDLVARNAINGHVPRYRASVLTEDMANDDMKMHVSQVLNDMELVPW